MKNYETPTVEIIEIQIEEAVLQGSGDAKKSNTIEEVVFGGNYGDF